LTVSLIVEKYLSHQTALERGEDAFAKFLLLDLLLRRSQVDRNWGKETKREKTQ